MNKIRLIAACALLAAALGAFTLRISRDMRDFEVPYTVAGRAAAAAAPLYRAEDEHYQFKYLPAFAVLAIPLGLMPLAVAKGVWFVGSVALLMALMSLSVRLLPEQRKSTRCSSWSRSSCWQSSMRASSTWDRSTCSLWSAATRSLRRDEGRPRPARRPAPRPDDCHQARTARSCFPCCSFVAQGRH